jgi:hypothetical protein
MEVDPLLVGDDEDAASTRSDSPDGEDSDSDNEKDQEPFVKLNNYSLSDMEMDFHDILEQGKTTKKN